MLRAILNKSWRQHPTRHQLYGHLPPITKTIQVRQTRHAGHCWRSKDELINDVLLWTPAYGQAKAGRPAWTYIQQLREDTGCSPEDLPKAMNDREKWRERVRDILASGTTWWWWFDPYTRQKLILPLQVKVDLRVMAIKEYSTLPKDPKLEPHHCIQFRVISRAQNILDIATNNIWHICNNPWAVGLHELKVELNRIKSMLKVCSIMITKTHAEYNHVTNVNISNDRERKGYISKHCHNFRCLQVTEHLIKDVCWNSQYYLCMKVSWFKFWKGQQK